MKVAFVVHDFDANFGQGRYGVEIASRLARRCEFTVYAHTFNAPDIQHVRWVRVPAIRWNVITTVLSFLPAAERLLRRDKPDVIHAQGLTGWSADVITGHICNAARSRSMAVHRRRARWFIQLVTPLERAFYRQRRASHLIAISRCLAEEIRTEYGWNKDVTVLHHGTNTVQFRPPTDSREVSELKARFRLPSDRWQWLFVGEAVKGLRQVIEQLPRFPDAHLLVISRSETAKYRELARSLGVLKRINFWGYEAHPELAFRAVDVFVYPSDYDPFGMVGSEAMASSLPVVLGDSIGVAELVRDGVNGLLCKPTDPDSIQTQLNRIRTEPGLGSRIGRAGRETVVATSWDHNSEEVFKIYSEIHRRRSASS